MSRAAAFFDVDGTLLAGNVVRYYANLRTQRMPAALGALWTAAFALRVPYYLVLDRASRGRFQQALYRNYRSFTPAELEARAREHCAGYMVPRLFPAALERVRAHRERQEPVVLVTGSLRPIVAPLAAHLGADDLVAAELEVRDGAYTGELVGGPLSATRKAAAVGDWAARHGLETSACAAYADSLDDLPMLQSVGQPHAVNPSARLERLATAAGWDILHWDRS
jgi:HAD superfamily hydrolase (TIGR01490 family)